ncbi:putative integral membrane protein [Diplogelasinospora grovesii]|uniref:Integral membrane protein n=1 Tax=Diplogelasinospora grovesii TaxID=303347 RepID=A0AAN6NIF3_9PEZI|nr:putative integral membrane protein [Diplogelasinospora grovesii]
MPTPLAEVDPSTLEGGLYGYGGDRVIACGIIFAVLCTVFLGLRFLSHYVDRRPFGADDWVMIPAWVLMMGLCANVILSVTVGGVGRHEAYVLQFEPQALKSWAQTLFVTEFLYGLLIPLEKSSILLLYLRLFAIHRWFRITTYVLLAYIWMWGISESLVAIFQCHPVAYQWDKTIQGGTCIDQLSYYRWVSLPNVIHDIAMLILPMTVTWKLQTGIRQKIALSSVFLIGSIGCVASFIRMDIFFQLNAFSDNTWASIQLMAWTLAEPGVILICACMPSLWPMIVRCVPSIKGTIRGKSGNPKYAGGGSSGSSHSRAVLEREPKHPQPLRGASGIWSGNNEFIQLKDVEDQPTTVYEVGTSYPDKSQDGILRSVTVSGGGGISVTRDFSWSVEANRQQQQQQHRPGSPEVPHVAFHALTT